MKSTKISLALVLLLIMSAISMPVSTDMLVETSEPIDVNQVSQAGTFGYLEVPYVWQEVNGYCMSAAISMVVQGIGLDLNMYDLFTAMGTGFAALYMGVNEMRGFFPGVLIRQPGYMDFFSELYGLETMTYMDTRVPFAGNAAYLYDTLGIEWKDFRNTTIYSPFTLLRDTIDAGAPLAVAVDLYYLPSEDYEIFKPHIEPLEATGIAHAITVVGYNETAHEVYIQDPGVGLWGEDYGYPDDGRWNYTLSYLEFDRAWQSAGYFAFQILPGSGPIEDFDERLGEFICQRLRGDRTSYFKGYENLFYLSPGKDAFSGMALDLTVESISEYAKYYTEDRKAEGLLQLGNAIETSITMHYHSYKTALTSISGILPDVDLTEFLSAANEALPHMDTLSHNSSITGGINVIFRDSLLFSTFEEIALDFDSTGDLDGSIAAHQDQLDEIADHLFAIADSWDAAADALEEAIDFQSADTVEGSLSVVVAGSGVIVLAVAILLFRRRK